MTSALVASGPGTVLVIPSEWGQLQSHATASLSLSFSVPAFNDTANGQVQVIAAVQLPMRSADIYIDLRLSWRVKIVA